MFGFKRVLNATAGTCYYIAHARLATDEYDCTEGGGNSYQIDLRPLYDEEEKPICNLTLSVSNNGIFASITQNLDKAASTHEEYSEELGMPVIHEDMQDCIVERDLLIVTTG